MTNKGIYWFAFLASFILAANILHILRAPTREQDVFVSVPAEDVRLETTTEGDSLVLIREHALYRRAVIQSKGNCGMIIGITLVAATGFLIGKRMDRLS